MAIIHANRSGLRRRTPKPKGGRNDNATCDYQCFLMLCAPAATEAADVTGNWAVTITTADGKITGKASLKLTGDKVTGQIGPSDDATIPIEGVLTAHKLTLKTHPRPGRTAAFDSCELTVGDEKMSGTIQGGDAGKGSIEFVRIKPSGADLK